jgi:YidC/Oxa1 family membrane protein insertase
MFEIPAALLSWFYSWNNSYIISIALMSAVVMAITTPLTLKSTKGMLEMQRIAPEMRKLQNEYRDDRQKLNEEMMKLYQEHKVNPMASCLPIFAQMPVFIIMFRLLRGWIYTPRGDSEAVADATLRAIGDPAPDPGFIPRYMAVDSELFQSIYDQTEIRELGLDLALSPFEAVQQGVLTGLPYVLLVVALAGLYFGQQRMVAARATISPTMSPAQQKIMQYLPVVFAVFQLFFLSALVVYYIFQTILRILQQLYITRKFYGHDEALGRQAQRASEMAREDAKKSGESTGLFAQAKRDLGGGNGKTSDKSGSGGKKTGSSGGGKKTGSSGGGKKGGAPSGGSKRVTPPKNRPTSSRNDSGGKGRPTPTRKQAQTQKKRSKSTSGRPKSSGKKKR